MTESHIEQAVAARIAAAKQRQEDMRRRRAELDAARRRGLAARHAAKLLNLRAQESNAGMGQRPTTVGQSPKVAAESLSAADDRGPAGTPFVRDSVSPTTDRQAVGLTVPVVTETVTAELDRSAADEDQP